MKIKNYFISIIIFFFTASISSQTNHLSLGCESPTLQSMQTFSHNNCISVNGCNSSDADVSNYIPNLNNTNKLIKLRLIIIHFSESNPKNFEKNNPEHLQIINELILELNNRFSNLSTTSEQVCNYESSPNCTFSGSINNENDTKIQFSLSSDDIHEIIDPYHWNGDNFNICGDILNSLNQNIQIGGNDAMNIFLVGSDCKYKEQVLLESQPNCSPPTWITNGHACANFPNANMNFRSASVYRFFEKYKAMQNGFYCDNHPTCCPLECPTSWWFNGFHGILAHELGHNLGLGHANQCHQSIMNQSGSSPRNHLFNNQIGKMHKMISTTNTRQYVLDCPVDDDTLFVSSNQVWSEDLKIYKEYIIIESGNTLTLDCHIQMPEGGTIIVQPNAQLIIDGGVITNTKDGNCNNLWQGIEVWGLSSYHQYKIGNFRFQGYVELKNNAIIENAITAISLGKGGDWQMENTGGVVEANNAIFKNNKRDIEFLQYQNHEPSDPNTPRPNLSYFKNCSFITDAPLADNQTPTSHVTIWNVDGVRFYGCTFENTNPSPPVGTLGKGIYTIDAHFNVTGCDWDSYCVPIGACCNKSANVFKDLEIGIHATYSSGSQYNYNVDNNIFENCMTNISNDGVNNAIITRNDHTIGFPRHSSWWTTGVYFNTGTGYRIEENTFDLALNPHITIQVGTWLTNTGENNNQVYKNTFNDLSHGNLAYLNNRASGSSGTGLAYFCNTHINSDMHDILVDASHPDLGGIRPFQVTSESNVLLDAGNEFSHTGNNPESDFSNSSPNSILYFYYTPPATKEPIYYSSNNINLFQLTGAQHNHSCPSLFSSSPKSLSQENIENYQNLFQYHNEKYLDNLALLNSFLDGGNTESLIEDINHANELDMWSLHNNLTEYSPFLTNNVLKSIVDRQDIFPNSLIYDILKSNPDEIRKGKILNYLSESEHHLSTWMIDSLEEESNNFTSRTSLESKVSFHRSKKDLYATLIAQDILEKKYRSEENHELNSNEYRNWIATYQTVHGAYQIVDDYFSQKEFAEGLNYFENISENYELNEFELQEYNDLKKLFTIISTVNLSERNIYLLTEEEENNLRDLANNGIGIARVRACNILSFVYGEECEFVKEFPTRNDLEKSKKQDTDIRTLEANLNVKIYPNPAKNYLELDYDFPLENSVYNVTIVDVLGKTHYQDKIQNQKGQIAIDTRMWNNGVYLINIQSNNNSAIFTDKFLISK